LNKQNPPPPQKPPPTHTKHQTPPAHKPYLRKHSPRPQNPPKKMASQNKTQTPPPPPPPPVLAQPARAVPPPGGPVSSAVYTLSSRPSLGFISSVGSNLFFGCHPASFFFLSRAAPLIFRPLLSERILQFDFPHRYLCSPGRPPCVCCVGVFLARPPPPLLFFPFSSTTLVLCFCSYFAYVVVGFPPRNPDQISFGSRVPWSCQHHLIFAPLDSRVEYRHYDDSWRSFLFLRVEFPPTPRFEVNVFPKSERTLVRRRSFL